MNGRRKMKHLRLLPSSVALALTLGAFNVNAQVNDFQPVTDEVLRNPSDADWLQWRRTYDGWAYSPLDQINRENVGDLRLAWSRALNAGGVELIPLVHDGVMYIPNPGGVIEAVDATTGDLIWQYRREPRRPLAVSEVVVELVTSRCITTRFSSQRQPMAFSLPSMPELEQWFGRRR